MHASGWIASVFSRVVARRRREAERRKEIRALLKQVEAAVSATEPKIRRVKGYEEQLLPAVRHALEYCGRLASAIPGPFRLDADRWGKDPLVTAYFATMGEARQVLGSSAELRRFFQGVPETEAYALLTMKPQERRIFRTAAAGELLRRDVPHASVNFYRHRFSSVQGSLSGLRQDLQHRAFHFLLSCALEALVALREKEARLEQQHETLQVKWRLQQSRERGLGALMGFAPDGRGAGDRILEEVSRELDSVRSRIDEPADYLLHLKQVLSAPEPYLSLSLASPRLDQMGIKVRKSDPDPGHEIPYAVVLLGTPDRRRAAVAARVFRNDVMDGQRPSGR